MKKPTYTLSIPQPCHERWDAMTPSEKGRFCASCQTQVVDFSGLSDREVIQLIEQSSGKVCGRLRPQQIDRPMVVEPWVQRASVRFSGFFAGLMMLSSAQASATPTEPVETIQNSLLSKDRTNISDVHASFQKDSTEYRVFGTVIDKITGEPLPFVNLTIRGLSIGTTTNIDGKFTLGIPKNQSRDEVVILVSFVGYENVEFNVSIKDLDKEMNLEIELPIKPHVLTGEVIITKEPKVKRTKLRKRDNDN